MLNLPNALTLLRILAVPLFLSFVVEHEYALAFTVFFAAGVTDGIDGVLARMWNQRTELGAHLDPLADKLLVLSAFIALGAQGAVPLQVMIIVILRDVVILGGYLLTAAVVGTPMPMRPSLWGKLTTFTQLSTVTMVLAAQAAWWVPAELLMNGIFTATAVACFVSGSGYVMEGLAYYQAHEEPPGL